MTRQLILLGFLLRLAIAIWNSFFGPSFGGDGDAVGLHEMAVVFSRQDTFERFHIGYLYSFMLAGVYRITWPSLFIGCVLSCIVWLVSALVMVATMDLLELKKSQQTRALAVYALLPSSVLWTSITIREPYQLLAVTVGVYAAVRIAVGGTARQWLLLMSAAVFGGMMHAALLGWGVLLAVAAAGVRLYRRRRSITMLHMAVAVPCVLLFVWLGYRVFTSVFQYPVDRGLAFAVQSYQRGGLGIGVRTDYRTSLTLVDALDVLLFLPVCLFQYLFEPMPWRVSSFSDVAIVVENVLRALLAAGAIGSLFRTTARQGPLLMLVLFAWFLLESAFSFGTFNWGTAARHHIPGIGLLAMLAFAGARKSAAGRPPVAGTADAVLAA